MAYGSSCRLIADGWVGAMMRRMMMSWLEQRDHLPITPATSMVVPTRDGRATFITDYPAVTTTVIVLTAQDLHRLSPCGDSA